jgi:hypothetical protein
VLLTIPVNEGALGDLEVLGNTGQAPAFGPKFEEPVFGVVSYITLLAFVRRLLRAWAHGQSVALVLGGASASEESNCIDAHGGTFELQGRAKFF